MKIDRVGVPSTIRHCGLSLSCWAWLGAALCAMAVIVIAWSYRDDWGIAVGLLAVMIVPVLLLACAAKVHGPVNKAATPDAKRI